MQKARPIDSFLPMAAHKIFQIWPVIRVANPVGFDGLDSPTMSKRQMPVSVIKSRPVLGFREGGEAPCASGLPERMSLGLRRLFLATERLDDADNAITRDHVVDQLNARLEDIEREARSRKQYAALKRKHSYARRKVGGGVVPIGYTQNRLPA